MIISLVFSLLITFITGYLFVSIFFQCNQLFGCHKGIKTSLGIGLGIGLSSTWSFILLLILDRLTLPVILIGDCLLLIIVALAYKASQKKQSGHSLCAQIKNKAADTSKSIPTKALFITVIIMVYMALLMFYLWSTSLPHGGWDAWSLWNANARFIFRAGDHWKNALESALLGSSTDYPWMYPVMVGRLWFYAGNDTTAGPIIMSGIFTFATVSLLGSSIVMLKNKQQALLGSLFLLTTPFFIYHASSQFADIPLAYYFLATMVLWQLFLITKKQSVLLLTGFTAGLAMFVKNEGIFFIIMLLINYAIAAKFFFRNTLFLKQLPWFLAGISLFVLFNILMRFLVPARTDSQTGLSFITLLLRMFDLERHQITIAAFLHVGKTFGLFSIPVWLLMVCYLLVNGISEQKQTFYRILTIFFQILFMLFGYYAIYIFISPDIVWHISGSLNRLYLQLWPTFLFFYFLLIQSPQAVESKNAEKNNNKNNKNKQI